MRVVDLAVGLRRWVMAFALGVAMAGAQPIEGTGKWQFNLGRNGVTVSSPAVADDGSVYIGVQTLSGGRVLAVNPADLSKPKWVRELPGFVESSPTIGPDGTVYVGCGDGKLYALFPATGFSRWECNLGAPIGGSSALGSDGTIYIGADDFALHAVRDGVEQWKFPTGGFITSSPAIATDGTIYFGSWDKSVYALTPEGVEKWRFSTGGVVHSSPAIGKDGTIYFGSGDQNIYAVTPDGRERWKKITNGLVDSSPVIGADGTIYIASTDLNFYALAPDDGSERWVTRTGTTTISTAVVRGDGVIIVGGDDGIVRALNPLDGSRRWVFSAISADDDIESSPNVGPDGTIYVGSLDGSLYAIHGNGSPVSTFSPWPAFRRDRKHTGRAIATNTGGQLANISTRAQAGGGNNLIAGFVVQGPAEKAYLVRAIGPGLAALGIGGFVADPALEFYSGQALLQRNDNWPLNDLISGFGLIDTFHGVGAFELAPGSKDAAIVRALGSGAFTARVTSGDGTPGVALVEVYDALGGDRDSRLLNLSTRGQVGGGANILIAGFVVRAGAMRLLLRGIGPGLSQFGVPGVLARPNLAVFDENRARVGGNIGWTADGYKYDLAIASASVAAFPLPENSADSAMVFDAQPGAYTIQISGMGTATGEAIVEIYVLP